MTHVSEALRVVLAAMICYSSTYLIGRMMQDRPIVVGFVVGLLLGDVKTGLVCGATLELVFLGVANIGGSNLNYCMATLFVTAFAIISGAGSTEQALENLLVIAVPVSTLGTLVEQIYRFISAFFVGYLDDLIDQNKQKQFSISRFVIHFLTHPLYWLVVFFGVAAGADAVQVFLNNLPPIISATMNVFKGLCGGIGLAVALNQIWDKKYAAWFFFGFVLSAYAGLPTIAILVISIAIAIAVVTAGGPTPAVATSAKSEEEEFLG